MVPFTDVVISIRATQEFPCEQDFEKCVRSIDKYTGNRTRFIFVDDCSYAAGAETIDRVAAGFGSSVVLRNHRQNWFSRAYNKGLRLVRTSRAVALNCDTFVGQNWLEELYEVWAEAEKNGQVGLVGSVYSEPEPRRWFASKPPAYVTGHCYLLSMEALQRVSEQRGMPGWYFDEIDPRRAHIHSDVELCHRLNSLGYQTVQSHKSYVMHLGGRSWGQRLGVLNGITAEYLRSLNE